MAIGSPSPRPRWTSTSPTGRPGRGPSSTPCATSARPTSRSWSRPCTRTCPRCSIPSPAGPSGPICASCGPRTWRPLPTPTTSGRSGRRFRKFWCASPFPGGSTPSPVETPRCGMADRAPDPRPLVTLPEAAELLQLPIEAVQALVGAGYLTPSGGELALVDLKAFLARNADNGAGTAIGLEAGFAGRGADPQDLLDALDGRA